MINLKLADRFLVSGLFYFKKADLYFNVINKRLNLNPYFFAEAKRERVE